MMFYLYIRQRLVRCIGINIRTKCTLYPSRFAAPYVRFGCNHARLISLDSKTLVRALIPDFVVAPTQWFEQIRFTQFTKFSSVVHFYELATCFYP